MAAGEVVFERAKVEKVRVPPPISVHHGATCEANRPTTRFNLNVTMRRDLIAPHGLFMGDGLDVLDPSADAADAATGLREGRSGGDARSGPGLAAPAARPLRDAPRFGSMPDFQRRRGSGFDERTLRSGGRLEGAERASGELRETSDGESDGG